MDMTLLKLDLFSIRALEGVHVEGEEKEILQEIQQKNRLGKELELIVVAAQALKQVGTKAMQSVEWREEDGVVYF